MVADRAQPRASNGGPHLTCCLEGEAGGLCGSPGGGPPHTGRVLRLRSPRVGCQAEWVCVREGGGLAGELANGDSSIVAPAWRIKMSSPSPGLAEPVSKQEKGVAGGQPRAGTQWAASSPRQDSCLWKAPRDLSPVLVSRASEREGRSTPTGLQRQPRVTVTFGK